MKLKRSRTAITALGLGLAHGGALLAQDAAPAPGTTLDVGNTAWMLAASALVLFMTPGLAIFYGGLVRSKNVLSTMMHSFMCMALVSVLWFMFCGGIAFGPSAGGYFGKPGELAFLRVDYKQIWHGYGAPTGMPTYVFFAFQMMFAIITPALISGAFAERLKFSGFFVFTALWLTFVYSPIAHWVWGGGILSGNADNSWLVKHFGLPGALDFAGGTVVHISSGVSALVFALVLGKRRGYPSEPMPPHSLPLCVLGAGILWFGWFGFNGGSGVASNELAGSAFFVTHLCAATTALAWAIIEWAHRGKASTLGVATGLVAGLVCITPASGFVGPTGAFIMGIAVAVVCYIFVAIVKGKFGYDDSLDAFGVHGIGGTVGALLTGVFALEDRGYAAGGKQFAAQLIAVVISWIWAGGVTFILLMILKNTIGIRASDEDEVAGLDVSQHGEKGYNL
jgi:Amt family ammonium transporter